MTYSSRHNPDMYYRNLYFHENVNNLGAHTRQLSPEPNCHGNNTGGSVDHLQCQGKYKFINTDLEQNLP